MKRYVLYTCIWIPGALSVVAFLIALTTSRRVDSGDLTYMEGYETILPWVWIPGFLLMPAFFLGMVLLIKLRWIALLQLGISIGLVFGWIWIVDSGLILNKQQSEQDVALDS